MRIELMKDIYLVGGGRFRYTHPINCNVYLIDGGSDVALVDAGCGFGLDSLAKSIKNHGFELDDITLILNTHTHWDHARGDSRIKQLSNCKIAVHEKGVEALRKGPWTTFPSFKPLSEISFEPVDVDIKIKDGDTVRIGDYELQGIHTPGHTADSTSFLIHHEGKKVLFSGDTVLSLGKLGIVTADTDFRSYKNSLERLTKLKADVLLPGHGIFVMSYAYEQVDFALEKIFSKWPDFAQYPQPFDSGAWDRERHPEWLKE